MSQNITNLEQLLNGGRIGFLLSDFDTNQSPSLETLYIILTNLVEALRELRSDLLLSNSKKSIIRLGRLVESRLPIGNNEVSTSNQFQGLSTILSAIQFLIREMQSLSSTAIPSLTTAQRLLNGGVTLSLQDDIAPEGEGGGAGPLIGQILTTLLNEVKVLDAGSDIIVELNSPNFAGFVPVTNGQIINVGTLTRSAPGFPVQLYDQVEMRISNDAASSLDLAISPPVLTPVLTLSDVFLASAYTSPIAPGASQTRTIQFEYIGVLPGVFRSTVSIANSDSDENPFTFTLDGGAQN